MAALGNMDGRNKLYLGDNLRIFHEYVPGASVDLVYLDPPFNSSSTCNVFFKEKSGEESAAQIMAFEDTWQWGLELIETLQNRYDLTVPGSLLKKIDRLLANDQYG